MPWPARAETTASERRLETLPSRRRGGVGDVDTGVHAEVVFVVGALADAIGEEKPVRGKLMFLM